MRRPAVFRWQKLRQWTMINQTFKGKILFKDLTSINYHWSYLNACRFYRFYCLLNTIPKSSTHFRCIFGLFVYFMDESDTQRINFRQPVSVHKLVILCAFPSSNICFTIFHHPDHEEVPDFHFIFDIRSFRYTHIQKPFKRMRKQDGLDLITVRLQAQCWRRWEV